MRAAPTILIAALALAGCQGSFGTPPGHGPGDIGIRGNVACPVDPDCGADGDGSDCDVCPEFWDCQYIAELMRKVCTNPGPGYPDNTHDWQCEDVGGRTVCRGTEYPDGGGATGWTCEMQAEWVVCTDDTPAYPDQPGTGGWDCVFEAEFRVCTEGGSSSDGGDWNCVDTATGRECTQDQPEYPDDRAWSCYDVGGETVCTAPGDVPAGGGDSGWDCESVAEFTTCRRNTPEYPDAGGDDAWDCYFASEMRICSDSGGDPPIGPPGPPDGGDDICAPASQRWCDDATYCSWGKQTCLPDGHWGPCIEPTVGPEGLADRPATQCACRYFYFNYDCCEDQMDRNADGLADCMIPADHTVPTCESDGSLCSYCDVHGDCGGSADMCLFARDGYAFCSVDCTSSACPGDFECQAIATASGVVNQCVPATGSCD